MTNRLRDEMFDRQLHEFLDWHAGDTAGAPSAMDVASRIGSRVGTTTAGNRVGLKLVWLMVLALLIAMLVGLGLLGAMRLPRPLETPSNGWIAFSTQPGCCEVGNDYNGVGGDIYLVREGVDARLIVSRGSANASNVCPAFSPDGRTMAYGHRDGAGRALVLLAVHDDGSVSETGRLDVPGDRRVPCPRWSPDGTRLAYLDGLSPYGATTAQPGSVVVRGLDGSILPPESGDPSRDDLTTRPSFAWPPLPSPSGDWVASVDDRGVMVERADGSDARVLLTSEAFARMMGYEGELLPYSIPAWSPDGKYVLAEADISGLDFAMVAISVESPTQSILLAPTIPVNCASCWPGRGDTSWQPVFTGSGK
jgi:Tol biopolymer transport system component